ncbi:MAG: hypothetical protein ACKOW3_10010 [Hyphomicrobium sp.]
MIELVILACLLDEPDQCKDVSLTFSVENLTPMQCVMQAQPEIAKWVEGHPRWVAKRWTCHAAGQFAKT